jgi:hypothetical protein
MWDKSAQGGSDKQQITYRHSSYDYRVSETLNSRQSALWQQELLEVRSYLARRVLPEDTASGVNYQPPTAVATKVPFLLAIQKFVQRNHIVQFL